VILEGAIGLALTPTSATNVHRFFADIGDAERKRRIVSEYVLRGKTNEVTNAIYDARELDEALQIIASAFNSIRASACI